MARMEPPTLRGANQSPLLLPLLPMLTRKNTHRGITPLSEGSNSKKRRLVWMAESLMAAGVDVKFPAEE